MVPVSVGSQNAMKREPGPMALYPQGRFTQSFIVIPDLAHLRDFFGLSGDQ
jgi:hypothetical protein